MENQKTVNLSNSSENEFSKFATKKWFVNDSETKGEYPHHDPIKFLTKSIVILMNIFSYKRYCCYKNYCCFRR